MAKIGAQKSLNLRSRSCPTRSLPVRLQALHALTWVRVGPPGPAWEPSLDVHFVQFCVCLGVRIILTCWGMVFWPLLGWTLKNSSSIGLMASTFPPAGGPHKLKTSCGRGTLKRSTPVNAPRCGLFSPGAQPVPSQVLVPPVSSPIPVFWPCPNSVPFSQCLAVQCLPLLNMSSADPIYSDSPCNPVPQ